LFPKLYEKIGVNGFIELTTSIFFRQSVEKAMRCVITMITPFFQVVY